MAPIPLTLIGVMPGHALLGAQFTATSMIGMIALAGIIVRNSILLVDFIEQELAGGMELGEAVIKAAAVRAKPIILTAAAAMLGCVFHTGRPYIQRSRNFADLRHLRIHPTDADGNTDTVLQLEIPENSVKGSEPFNDFHPYRKGSEPFNDFHPYQTTSVRYQKKGSDPFHYSAGGGTMVSPRARAGLK